MMALRGKKPESIEKRLKALFYGNAGVGKTTAAIQFPAPYLIDTEKGAVHEQYIRQIEKVGGAIYQTSDWDELITEIKSLLTEKHEYKTLVIDPLTMLYNDLLDKAALKVGTDYGKHYGEANKRMKHLLTLLLRLDMNVIVTAHAKNEYGEGMMVLGQTFDCYKKLDYLFDLVLEIQRRGKDRVGVVKKSRIENLIDGDSFKFSYDEVAIRYGVDILEKEAVPENFATIEQQSEIKRLIDVMKIDTDIVDKWLTKANAESFSEMKSDDVQKCIDYLKSKLQGE